MKTTIWIAVALLLALPPSDLPGQDEPEIHIFMNIDNEPLSKVANKLALSGDVTVEVEPELREKKITLKLEDPVLEALEKVAAAAGAYLVKTGSKSFAFRTKPAVAGETAAPKAVPEWIRPLAKRLDETKVTFTWVGKPLPEIVTWLSKKSGVRIRLDPRVKKEKTKQDMAIHIAEYDERMVPMPITSSARRAMEMALSYPTLDLSWTWRSGGILISTRKHIQALSPKKAPPGIDPKLTAKIAAARITLKLTRSTVKRALEKVAKQAAVKIDMDRELRKALRKDRLNIDVKDLPLLEALKLILAPRGLVAEPGKKGFVVRRKDS